MVTGALPHAASFDGVLLREHFKRSVSGRDHDKFQEKGLTVVPLSKVRTPMIRECILHYECQVVHKNDLSSSELKAPIVPKFYPEGDFHRLYFGEILACYKEEK